MEKYFGDAVGFCIVVLSQAFLHSVDWVHHDISACNVLRSGKIGKIDGLECAKHMDYKTTHKVATVCEFLVRGTAMDVLKVMLDFVACKVGVQDYLFEPHVCRPFGCERECPFRFNPLHHMESVWWIAMWAVYYPDVQAGQPLSEQVRCFRVLFPRRLGECTNAFLTALKFKVPTPFVHAGCAVECIH
ncbi:hypothetical protein EDD15DRAFT_1505094 [Pisolithus albus]|nr:hypothetical protein EDD15DRAFT_1505094 [Pisolithus albus]